MQTTRIDPASRNPEAEFRALYAAHGRAILAYAVRRCGSADDAADVVAETFLVAWRRCDDVPEGDAARLWLYGVARRVMANQQRSERRRERLAERLAWELPAAIAAVTPPGGTSDLGLVAALAELDADDREVLLLAGWEELEPAEIATVLGISPVAARSRLHRARRRLRHAMSASAPAHSPFPTLEKAR